MKHFACALFCISICFVLNSSYGQAQKSKPTTFVLKGKVKNFTDKSWNFLYTGLFNNQGIDVPVAADGSFSKTLDIANPSDIYLYLNDDAIVMFAVPGDTLTINWDNKDFKKTFNITTNKSTPWRQTETDLMLDLYRNFRPRLMDIEMNFQSKTPDSLKVKQVKRLLADEIKTIFQYPQTWNSMKILYDEYFRNKGIVKMLNREAKQHYEIALEPMIPDSMKMRYGMLSWSNIDKTLDERLFLDSYEYREYVYDKARFMDESPFNSTSYEGTARVDEEPNYTMIDCYKAMINLSASPMIRDWFLAKTIINGFNHYSFDAVEQGYNKFLPDMKTPLFINELTKYYNTMLILKPGKPAPAFSLKDVNGKMVSLADFKGKVVFVDFWGVHCGPCVYDIKTYAARFHEKYNKNIVYLNICVGSDIKEWTKALIDMHMDGINLSADFISDPACMAYHIDAIPHYIIIDAKGNIVNNNAPRMGDLLGKGTMIKRDKNGKNELDIALEAM